MNKYKEAAELLFKRLFGIYGAEMVVRIATTCGYEIDASGNVFSVVNEEEAFERLSQKIETELGPIALIGCKIALMHFFSYHNEESVEIKQAEELRVTQVEENMDRGIGAANGKEDGDWIDVLTDCVLLIDSEHIIIGASGLVFKGHIPGRDSVIGKKLCDLFKKRSQDCTVTTQLDCPVKRSMKTMAPVELEMPVNGRQLKWRSFPFTGMTKSSEKALVYIHEVTAGLAC